MKIRAAVELRLIRWYSDRYDLQRCCGHDKYSCFQHEICWQYRAGGCELPVRFSAAHGKVLRESAPASIEAESSIPSGLTELTPAAFLEWCRGHVPSCRAARF